MTKLRCASSFKSLAFFGVTLAVLGGACAQSTAEVRSLEAGDWTELIGQVVDNELRLCLDTSATASAEPSPCPFDDASRNPVFKGADAGRLVATLPAEEKAGRPFRGQFTARRVDNEWRLTGSRNLDFWTPS